jgi:hypothetical protein
VNARRRPRRHYKEALGADIGIKYPQSYKQNNEQTLCIKKRKLKAIVLH